MVERSIVLCASPRPYSTRPRLTGNQHDFSERHPKADRAVKQEFIASLLRWVLISLQGICHAHPVGQFEVSPQNEGSGCTISIGYQGYVRSQVVPRSADRDCRARRHIIRLLGILTPWPHRIIVFVIIVHSSLKRHSSLLVTHFLRLSP